jgi:hypothetical protein
MPVHFETSKMDVLRRYGFVPSNARTNRRLHSVSSTMLSPTKFRHRHPPD